MAQQARFWTYRAGTRVLTADGCRVGRVSAVRRDEVLVARADGESSWIAAGDVLSYDGSTLTVSPSISVGAETDHLDSVVRADQMMVERTLLSAGPTSFDA